MIHEMYSHIDTRNVFVANTFDATYLKYNRAYYILDIVKEELSATFSTRTDFLVILRRIGAHLDLLVNLLRRDASLDTVQFRNNDPGNLSRVEIYVQMRYNEAIRATMTHVEAVRRHITHKLKSYHVNALSTTLRRNSSNPSF